jgi:hypothetical protein
MFLLAGCSADDGRPITGPTGPSTGTGSGTGTGTGTGTGNGTGSGENRQEQPTDTTQSTSPTDPSSATAKKANGESPCAANSECQSGVCFIGGTQSYCALKCTAADAATVCAAPFTGSCNKQGFCKRD